MYSWSDDLYWLGTDGTSYSRLGREPDNVASEDCTDRPCEPLGDIVFDFNVGAYVLEVVLSDAERDDKLFV